MNTFETVQRGTTTVATETARFMASVYRWMTGGILLSAIVSTFLANNPQWIMDIVGNRFVFFSLLIAQFAAVITLSAAINRLSAFAAASIFIGYSALSGVTLSIYYLIYTRESLALVFGATAFAFAGLSMMGYITKRDLGPIGTFCGMALWGMIGFALMSFIFPSMWSEQTSWWYSIIGVLVFSGLTAYDTQKIKSLPLNFPEGSEPYQKLALLGALTLYLDFINLFLSLLRLMGRRR